MEVTEIPTARLAEMAAPYNPRKISSHDLDALRRSLKFFGTVEPIIVNKRSGRIVGGHQRVRAAAAEGIETLPVVHVDLDEPSEKQLNLALNRISGEFDLEKLAEVLGDLEAAGADLGLSTIVNGLPGGEPFRIPDHMPLLRAKVIETGARLVVVDPLYGFLDPKALSDAQVRRALKPLVTLADETGAAVLVVRHLTKKSGKAMYQGGGSIAVVALARTAMRVDADPEHPGRSVLAVVKCNLGPRAPSIRYRLVERIVAPDEDQGLTAPAVAWLGTTELTADDLAAGPGGAVQEASVFLKQVLKDGPMPAMELFALAKEEGLSEISLRRAAKKLNVKKKKVHEGDKTCSRWSLASVSS